MVLRLNSIDLQVKRQSWTFMNQIQIQSLDMEWLDSWLDNIILLYPSRFLFKKSKILLRKEVWLSMMLCMPSYQYLSRNSFNIWEITKLIKSNSWSASLSSNQLNWLKIIHTIMMCKIATIQWSWSQLSKKHSSKSMKQWPSWRPQLLLLFTITLRSVSWDYSQSAS